MELTQAIKKIKEYSLRDTTEVENREILYYFFMLNYGRQIPQVIIAKINDWLLFDKNVVEAKNYFKCFIFDE